MKLNGTEQNVRVNQIDIYCINLMVTSRYLLMHFHSISTVSTKLFHTEQNGRVNQMEIYCINLMVMSRYLLMHFEKGPPQIKRCCDVSGTVHIHDDHHPYDSK